jgi:hypothetical protein
MSYDTPSSWLPAGLEHTGIIWNIRGVNNDSSAASDGASPAQTVTLEFVAGQPCGGGECPTVYKTNYGTLVVQGYPFAPAQAGVEIPAGEQMVEIPADLLADYVRAVSS